MPGLKKEDDVPAASASEVGVVKANKGMILRKSVDYIRSAFVLVVSMASAYFSGKLPPTACDCARRSEPGTGTAVESVSWGVVFA